MHRFSGCAALLVGIIVGSSTAARAQSASASPPPAIAPATVASGAHVTVDLGNGSQAEFDARSFDLTVAHSAGSSDTNGALPEIHLVKRAGPFTGTLVQATASGQHFATVIVAVPDSVGGPAVTLTLSDAVLSTDRLVLTNARESLEQERISDQEAFTQLTADYQEAQRQLAVAEQLGRSRVTTPQDLLRARERAAELQQRLDLARQRQAMLQRQLAAQGALDEELTLRFARIEIDGVAPGARGAWDFTTTASQPQKRPRQ